MGAIIFLLSLALDPFYQQLLSYPARPGAENPSTVPRLIRFFNPSTVSTADGMPLFSGDRALAKIATFFRGPEVASTPLAFCPGDSCTWPDFNTLAVCSTCTDIRSYLTHACLEESGSWRSDFDPEPPRTNSTRTKSCGWFFNASSDDPLLMTGYNLDGHGTLLSRHFPYHDTIQNDIFWGGSLLSKSIPQPIADFAAVSNADLEAVHRNDTPQAFSCTLRWCVKRMRASFHQGIYQEETLSTFVNDTAVAEPLSCTTLPDGTRDWKYDGNITISPPNATDTYFIEDNTMLTARFAIDAYVPNQVIQPNATARIVAHYPLPTEDDGGPKTDNSYNFLWLQKHEVPKIVDRLANSMTSEMRNDPRYGEVVHGSGMLVTYVDVDWRFFSFPVVVLILTMVLLLATIVQTYKKDVWKASDLTTLIHGLSEEAKECLMEARSMQDVRDISKDLPVFLTTCDKGRRQLQVAGGMELPKSDPY